MPHPNEPTGALAALWLAESLARDENMRSDLGLVWHFVPCADPDGARLNESWFSGPFSPAEYAAGVYRPPIDEQFEWTFHRAELDNPGLAAMPESRAVMAVIDALRPELLVSMHNAEDGGLYTFTTDERPELRSGMETISTLTAIPLELGAPDGPGELLSPGVFHEPVSVSGIPGVCSTDYAGQYGALGLTVEPPLWVDPRAGDDSPVKVLAAEFDEVRAQARERHQRWVATIRDQLDLDTARGRAVLSDVDNLGSDWPPHSSRTVAERASWERTVDLERRRAAGHIIGLLHSQGGELNPALRGVLDDATTALSSWAGPRSVRDFVGLRGAIACHAGVALAAAAGLAGVSLED